MKPISIYNALGIVEIASDKEVSFALRRLLRYTFKKTRDNLGTSEETLRFFNHASQILCHPKRRDLYDKEWAESRQSSHERIHLINAVGGRRSRFDLAKAKKFNAPAQAASPDLEQIAPTVPMPAAGDAPENAKSLELLPKSPKLGLLTTNFKPWIQKIPTLIPTLKVVFQTENAAGSAPANVAVEPTKVEPPTEKKSVTRTATRAKDKKETFTQCYHPLLTDSVVIAQTPSSAMIGAILAAILAIGLLFSNGAHIASTFEFAKIWVWLPVGILGVFIYIAGYHRPADHIRSNFHIVSPTHEEAVRGWRRRNMVFMGSNLFTEESSWIFQLRLAELERARLQRVTVAPIWRRAVARLFDYMIWGWFLFFLLRELGEIGILSKSALALVDGPLLIPVIVSLTWVPVEALMTAAVGTTLGKWLFGIYVQFSVSNPYTPRLSSDCWQQALTRSFRVWMQGVGLGVVPFTIFMGARSLATLKAHEETEWDSDLDTMVSYVPMRLYAQAVAYAGAVVLTALFLMLWQGQVLAVFGAGASIWERETTSARETFPAHLLTAEESFAAFQEEMLKVSEESKIYLEKREWRRAYESCTKWSKLAVANPEPFRCQGIALQNLKRHQEAINAFRLAQIHSPRDRSLDEDIKKSQDEIFYQLNRNQ